MLDRPDCQHPQLQHGFRVGSLRGLPVGFLPIRQPMPAGLHPVLVLQPHNRPLPELRVAPLPGKRGMLLPGHLRLELRQVRECLLRAVQERVLCGQFCVLAGGCQLQQVQLCQQQV